MIFTFPPSIQAGIAAGNYEPVRNAMGVMLGLARDKATGQFVGHAVGMLGNAGLPLNPIAVPLQFAQMFQTHLGFQSVQSGIDIIQAGLGVSIPLQAAMQVGQMYQTHRGFQAVLGGLQTIRASLGVLQMMATLTGVGVAANVAISAVSLWQILKLRDDVKSQRLETREGFLDLKQILKEQGNEVMLKIDEAVQTIEFNNHQQALSEAYSNFLQATKLMQTAMLCKDVATRNADLANVRQSLANALATYRNPKLLPGTDAVTKLRRAECTWAIEQTIILTYYLQEQLGAVSERLMQLQASIRQDVLEVVEQCESVDELDIIFPEILHIHDHDLAALAVWQAQVDWLRSLSPEEQALLQQLDSSQPELEEPVVTSAIADVAVPPEQLLYENFKQKSHFAALRDVLILMMKPDERPNYTESISQRSAQAGYKALTGTNLQQMSDFAIANLYWYFRVREEAKPDQPDISERSAA